MGHGPPSGPNPNANPNPNPNANPNANANANPNPNPNPNQAVMAGLVQHLPPQQVPRIEALGQDRNYAALWAASPLSVFRQCCELVTAETSPDEPPLVA